MPVETERDEIPSAVLKRCIQLGLEAPVRSLLAVIHKTYPEVERVELVVFRDENGEDKVRVHASVKAESEDEAEKYLACLAEWSATVHPDLADKVVLSTS